VLFRSIVKKHNGMPSGEHGIGISKKEILKDFISERELEIMKKIKKIFDPDEILNPGKIFDL
jgi:glycolate oxidase